MHRQRTIPTSAALAVAAVFLAGLTGVAYRVARIVGYVTVPMWADLIIVTVAVISLVGSCVAGWWLHVRRLRRHAAELEAAKRDNELGLARLRKENERLRSQVEIHEEEYDRDLWASVKPTSCDHDTIAFGNNVLLLPPPRRNDKAS